MKPLLFRCALSSHHNGVCEHIKDYSPEQIIILQSNMWEPAGMWIGRIADAPWDALKGWLEWSESAYAHWSPLDKVNVN